MYSVLYSIASIALPIFGQLVLSIIKNDIAIFYYIYLLILTVTSGFVSCTKKI